MPEIIKKLSLHRKFSALWLLIFFVLGGVIVFFINYFINLPSIVPTSAARLNDASYTYINPLLECDSGSGISEELQGFKDDVQTEVDKITASKKADLVAIYFRDMDNGPFFDINGSTPFIPASLLKVPVAMAYYNQAESDPNLLSQKITFASSTNTNIEYFQSSTITLGQTYTVEQLIKYMLVNSDNDALDLLLSNAVANNVDPNQTFKDLSVNLPSSGLLTVKQYSTFFRILFNSSYLDYDDSEKTLSLLAQSTFTQGLRAGVPANIPVAHKFGESWSYTSSEKELHDCGIIYYPDHPYLLCVMTQGTNFDDMAASIADISKFVYGAVHKQLE